MSTIIVLADATEFLGGGIMLFLACMAFLLGVLWLLFPFLMLNAIGKLRDQNDILIGLQRTVAKQGDELLRMTGEMHVAILRQTEILSQESGDSFTAVLETQKIHERAAVHLHNIDAATEHTNALLKWIGDQKAATPQE